MLKKTASFIFLAFLCQFVLVNQCLAKKPKRYSSLDQYKYQQKILRKEEVEKYKRSLLPESGNMTREEYEQKSKDIPTSEIEVKEYQLPKDINMKYVPQPKYKLARYNNPPGSVELHLGRSLNFDRQFICPGITSPLKDILVYPVVYFYALNQCTSCDLFVIPLDASLPDITRIKSANVIKRNPEPILSTDKTIKEKFIFRTMTPVDFSQDGTKLVAKEKIGNVNDGVWQTNIWVYDFRSQTAKKLPEIRDAIKFYWENTKQLVLDEKRWDIYPMGFDAQDPERIVVSAYGYTGNKPIFLGMWGIDCSGERATLISLFNDSTAISANGYKLVEDDIVDPVQVYQNEKLQKKKIKKKRKAEKKALKKEKKAKKVALKRKLRAMKKEEHKNVRLYKKQQKYSYPTG